MGTPIYVAPEGTNEPTVDHEPSVSSAARRAPSDEHQSRSSLESSEHGGLLHQLLPQTSSSRQRSLRSPDDAAVAAKDDDVDDAVVSCYLSLKVGCVASCPASPAAMARRRSRSVAVIVLCRADGLRRACVAATAAACVVIGAAGGGDVAASTTPRNAAVVVAPRWSDRRECPPWRANSLENIVPENLPRPSAPRRFDSVSASAAAPSFLGQLPGTGCFSL